MTKTESTTFTVDAALVGIRMSDKLVEQFHHGDTLPPHTPHDEIARLLNLGLVKENS